VIFLTLVAPRFVSGLTDGLPRAPDIDVDESGGEAMNSFDMWLRKKVLKLEHEIRTNPVFDRNSVPTREELLELRRLTVIHRFLNGNLQQLESRGTRSPDAFLGPRPLVVGRRRNGSLAVLSGRRA